MGGNPAFRGTRVPVHVLAKLVGSRVRAHVGTDGKCGGSKRIACR
jgi:hypothetical protein